MATLNVRYTPPTGQSDANQWFTWFEQIEKAFGKIDAAQAFSARWKITDAGKGPANTSDFRMKMQDKGISIGADGLIGSYIDTVKTIGNTVGGFFKIGGSVMFTLYVVTFIVVIAIVWKLAKPEAVGTIIKYAK